MCIRDRDKEDKAVLCDERCARPIGVFDSGVGGLTVLAQLQKTLPGEDTIFLGDNAYGP